MEKFNTIRKKIFDVIEPQKRTNRFGWIYDVGMLIIIFLSIFPLVFKETNTFFYVTDIICVTIFIIDYILRWATADFKFKKHSWKSFVKYPFTPMAIVDLLSILPSLTIINNAFKLFRLFRAARILRLVRVLKFVRYSENAKLLHGILKKSARPLITVGIFGIAYAAIAGLIMFNVEPEHFNTYFDAIYWVIIVWNQDPTTVTGHIIAICSIIFGLSLVALPASIISAEYIDRVSHIRHKADLKKEIAEVERDVEKELEKDLEKDIKKEIKKDIMEETTSEKP